jgi:hypothetical protein
MGIDKLPKITEYAMYKSTRMNMTGKCSNNNIILKT